MPVTENCELRGADPGCYGCQGTGKIRWAGVDPETRCPCTRWCVNHDRACDDDDEPEDDFLREHVAVIPVPMPPRNKPASASDGPVEFLRGQVTYTDTGNPASIADVRGIYGVQVGATSEAGWFWIPHTPKAAARTRKYGHHASGSKTTTRIPNADGLVPDPTRLKPFRYVAPVR